MIFGSVFQWPKRKWMRILKQFTKLWLCVCVFWFFFSFVHQMKARNMFFFFSLITITGLLIFACRVVCWFSWIVLRQVSKTSHNLYIQFIIEIEIVFDRIQIDWINLVIEKYFTRGLELSVFNELRFRFSRRHRERWRKKEKKISEHTFIFTNTHESRNSLINTIYSFDKE